jgi:16S rRNA (guanine527-N7)-methyltransferase
MQVIQKYFPNLTDNQNRQFTLIKEIYADWNQKINVVSRKDVDEIYKRHVLHSLGIAKVVQFPSGSTVMDVGTGGGFPGIPLAILFPEVKFVLVDSIGKKIKVVNEVAARLDLKNVETFHTRVETLNIKTDYIVSRAVARMDAFARWTEGKFYKQNRFSVPNGIFYLKGGDLTEELEKFPNTTIYNLSVFFEEAFFETKKIVYLPH